MKPDERARALYRSTFGKEPAAVASAPGRVNLIGEHVDYHGGHVLPVATEERTAVAVGPGDGRLRAASEQAETVEGAWPPTPRHAWTDYVAGVAVEGGDAAPRLAHGLAVAVASDVPVGAGLSSSAAIGVATALALVRWAGRSATGMELADLAYRSETRFVGMPCGRMDQIASAATPRGAALLLNCATLETSSVPVGVDLVVAESGETHALRGSEYETRRAEGDRALAALRAAESAIAGLLDVPPARLPWATGLLAPPLDRRVRHVVNENQRTILAAQALERSDHATFGALVNASHDSLRDLYECSTPRLDAIVTAARALPGVLGARLVGAGWGGSVLVIVQPGAGAQVADRLRNDAGLALPAVRRVVPGVGAVQS
jgi:galactokinase